MRDFMLGPVELAIILVIIPIWLIPFWRIFTKAGYNGALSLLMLVPFLNLIMLYFLAFAEWPSLRRPVR